jgi:HK97 family phage portal protein
MGLLTTLLERRSINVPAVPLTSASLSALLDGPTTATGRSVSAATAMKASAVFACVRVRAETVASLPWVVYRRIPGGGKERDPQHPLYELLHDQPNPAQTAIEFRENLVGNMDLWGNAYAEIEWDTRGQVRALWPLRPDRVREEERNGRLYYVVTLPNGEQKGLPDYRVWHTRGFMGQSVIANARESIGLALAGEEYGARFFGNDSRPGGILKSPKVLSKEAAKNLKASWEAAHSGLENRHRVAVLEEGVEWQQIGIPPEDAQYLELRQFQVVDIARFFRVPPHKIASLERATFSNIEHQSIEFVVDCIRPICVRLEQSARRCLLTTEERPTWLAEHVIDGLLRGDTASRYAAYATARQWGWMSADDVRELENMNPLPDGQGKMYLVPMNMTPAGEAGQQDGGSDGEN